MTKPARDARVTIRLPEALRDKIEREAERQRRSISDTIVILLTDALVKGGR